MNKFENGRFYGAKRLVESRYRKGGARDKILRERGAFPKEEGDAIGAYKTMNEENFLSGWLREDVRVKEERVATACEKNEEERCE